MLPNNTFQGALSMPTCTLKLLKKIRNSDEVGFSNATSTSSRKASHCDSMLNDYTCKTHRDRSCSLTFRRQTLPPSGTHTQRYWGSQASQHQLEQTLLNQHLSSNFSTHSSTPQFQNAADLSLNSHNIKAILLGLPNKLLFLSCQ